MIEPEGIATLDDIAVVRWRDAMPPAGLTALVETAVAAGYGWIGDFLDDWRRRPFLEDGEALFLALRGGTTVGMAVISADPHVADHDTGRLRYIFVAEAARGRGLLRVFVDACLSRGKTRWRRLRLHTDNPIAAQVYEDHGFVAATGQHRSTHVRGCL